MIKLLLADDHRVLLDGFIAIFEKVDDMDIVATASNGKQVLNLLENNQIDLVLLDINMPVLNGVETCKKITAMYPGVKVVALSMHKKASFIKRMLQYGASGYILKDDTSADIIEGLRKIVKGQKHFSHRVLDLVLNTDSVSSSTRIGDVTKREIEVLQLISHGLTNQEIATELFISHHTAESHRRNLLEKFNAKNSVDLVRKGMEKGII